MRPNPGLNIEASITELAVGEALVSFLDAKGTPAPTCRAWVYPPASKFGPATPEQCRALIASSLVAGVYEQTVDRESAFEMLKARTAQAMAAQDAAKTPAAKGEQTAEEKSTLGGLSDMLFGTTGAGGRKRQSVAETMAKSAARSIGSQVGRELMRGILGSLLGSSKRR